ncbi:hypothetical protein K492DRAFT_132223 [Lichtheimia hyalospora FSU 10163]|nr:hypothetical protein K492DRAFT_132223 [Lichtheimia hyalospora FSU 10163]
MTAGLVFVWTHKLLQADVVRLMDELDCRYVENLVWFKKYVNNIPVDQPSPYISSSKEILLIFRKVSSNIIGDGFELRHQRSPDVIIDFEQPASQWIQHEFTEPKPAAVYDMIETLLPKAGYDEELGRGRLLDLWTKRDAPRRDGWIAFHQTKPSDAKASTMTAQDDTTHEINGIHHKAMNETNSKSIEDQDDIMDIL